VETAQSRLRLRVPTGADQEAVADLPDDEAVRVLFERCLLAGAAEEDDDFAAAEEAIEEMAPEVALAALAACPACRASNEIVIDPYLVLATQAEDLFVEVHRLASSYHWSEAEILALPRARRQLYLRLIDQARGLVQ
jgi:hypothetical protein